MEISSTQNPNIKAVVKLKKRRERDAQSLFVVEGNRELNRALESGWELIEFYSAPSLFSDEVADRSFPLDAPPADKSYVCTKEVFKKISIRENPDGILGVFKQKNLLLSEIKLSEAPLLLVCDHIEKPGNLGAMLRTADAAGVDAVIVCDAQTDMYNPNVVRASMGALFMLPVILCESHELIPWLKQHHINILSTTPQSESLYCEKDLTKSTALVMGAEHEGLSEDWLQADMQQIKIPMLGSCDSLNVSNTSAIILYEAIRQRNRDR